MIYRELLDEIIYDSKFFYREFYISVKMRQKNCYDTISSVIFMHQ